MNLFDLLNHNTILLLFKWMIVIALFLYTFFAFLITKQIKVMNKAVSTKYSRSLYLFGTLHLLLSLLILILAIIIL